MPFQRKYKTGKEGWKRVSEESVKRAMSSCYHSVRAVIVEMKENPGRVVHTNFSYFRYTKEEK